MKDFERIDRIVKLLIADRNQLLSEEDNAVLNEWIEEEGSNKALYNSLSNEKSITNRLEVYSDFNKKIAYSKFIEQTKVRGVRSFSRHILRYAAVILPLIAIMYFTYLQVSKVGPGTELTEIDMLPGSSKAVLILEDGNVINLEEEEDIRIEFRNIEISNNKREIVYKSFNKGKEKRNLRYNTLKIPRGGEYQLTLSDGTKVWLNSESNIKYPVQFLHSKREVYLEGEAYFEVAENEAMPFIINTSKIAVNVLGTSFNVRAYDDEDKITTTLVSGKVMIYEPSTQMEFTLQPNEQAVTSNKETVVRTIDVNQFIAWKEGRILFEDNTVEEIFNDLSRWYDIEIEYSNQEVKFSRYSIDIIRYENLNEVLEILELTKKIKFEISENRLLIMEN